jgi:hypothetical protein
VTDVISAAGLIDKRSYKPIHALRGKLVHEATMLWDDDELGSCDRKVAPYVKAYAAFRDEFSEPWIFREQRLIEPTFGYSGQPDRGALVYRHGHPVGILVDLKTGGPEPWHGIQLAAYGRLYWQWLTQVYEDLPGIHVDPAFLTIERWVVHLRSDGTFQRRPCVDPQDWSVFLACLTLDRYQRRTHGKTSISPDAGEVASRNPSTRQRHPAARPHGRDDVPKGVRPSARSVRPSKSDPGVVR